MKAREGFRIHSARELNSGAQMLLKSIGSKSAAVSVEGTRSSSRDSFHGPSAEQTVAAFVCLLVWAGNDKIVIVVLRGVWCASYKTLELNCEGVVVKNKHFIFFRLFCFFIGKHASISSTWFLWQGSARPCVFLDRSIMQ